MVARYRPANVRMILLAQGLLLGSFLAGSVLSCSKAKNPFRLVPPSAEMVLQLPLTPDPLPMVLSPTQREDWQFVRTLCGGPLGGPVWMVPFPAGEDREANLLFFPRPPAWTSCRDSLLALRADQYEYQGVTISSFGKYRMAELGRFVLLGEHAYLLEDAVNQWKNGTPRSGWGPPGSGVRLWMDESAWKDPKKGPGASARNLSLQSLSMEWETDSLAVTGRYRSSGPQHSVPADSLLSLLSGAVSGIEWLVVKTTAPDAWPAIMPPVLKESLRARTGLAGGLGGEQAAIGILELKPEAADVNWMASVDPPPEGPYSHQLFELFRFSDRRFPATIWPDLFSGQGPCWAVQADRFLFFCADRPVLERWLDQYLTGQVLGRDPDVLTLLPSDNSPAWAWLLIRPGPEQFPLLRSKSLVWMAFADGRIRCRAREAAGNDSRPGAAVAWRRDLDATVVWGPYPFEQAGVSRLAVQDATHRLYVVQARTGRLEWSYPMARRLLPGLAVWRSGLSDAYRLGVCSPGQLFVLDDRGGEVGPFPLDLEVEATAGPGLLLQGSLSGHVLFVPAANGGIYAYAEDGKPLPGWNPRREVGEVRHPVMPVRFGQETYVIACTVSGALLVLDRRGRLHFPTDTLGRGGLSPPGLQLLPAQVRLVLGTPSGLVRVHNLRGQAFNLRLAQSEGVRFLFSDVLGDQRKDYISLDGRQVRLHRYQGNAFGEAASGSIPFPADTLYQLPSAGPKHWIGLWNRLDRKALVLDSSLQAKPEWQITTDRPLQIVALKEGSLLGIAAMQTELTAFRATASR